MRVDDGLASIQLLEHRRELRIAQPGVAVAGQDADAVRLECVERVGDLLQAALHVGQRQHREEAETALVVGHHLRGGVLVHLARELARFLRVPEPDAGRGDRQHRGLRPDAVERLDGSSRRIVLPCREAGDRADRVLRTEECEKTGRDKMLMDVDPPHRGRLRLSRGHPGSHQSPRTGRQRSDKLSPGCTLHR